MKLSKTILVNALVLAAGFGTWVLNHNLITDNPELVSIVAGAVAALNVGLRYFTTSAMAGLFTKAE